jgi:3-oxoacyl-[acyl-carrier-protein] synthase III
MPAIIRAIEYYLPDHILANSQLEEDFPEWSAGKIAEKTGIFERRIAADHECSSDLGVAAAQKLFDSGVCQPSDIGYLLFCTQSPDYFLPTTACILQDRLGLNKGVGALDFNLGCSGFVYGLGIAKGLIETGQTDNVLLITAETYSKFIHNGDKSTRTLFGDAAAATLVQHVGVSETTACESCMGIGPFVYGSDGSGANNLIVPTGGMRNRYPKGEGEAVEDEFGNLRTIENLYMNGPEIFAFTLRVVPKSVKQLLSRAGITLDDIDLFVFHQANQYMLDHLCKKIKIPKEKFYIGLRDCGNTVSSTIPIGLKNALNDGILQPGQLVMLVGFGVGYSWGATLIRWEGEC